MTFRQFAFNNVIRNKRLYAAYFLSSLFTVMVFFTFAIFAFHPVFFDGSIRGEVLYGMAVAGGIIYVFSFFFVLYSMSAFLQSRKKEFGLLMTQGMSTRQIRLMVFMENMLIGLFATVGGIMLGLIFAKVILLLAENVLVIDEELAFYFPLWAIVITFLSFIFLFFCISLFVSFILRTRKLADLIKGDKQSKGEPKASVILAIIAAVLLAVGYGTALYVKGVHVVFAMLPVIVVVTIGTYLFFTQLSVYIIRRMKRRKGIFWRKTNMVLFADLSFRMKDNARTFFMVAIISTVAFSAIGSLYGFQSFLMRGLEDAMPFTFTYNPYADESDEQIAEDVAHIDEVLKEEQITANRAEAKLNYYDIGIDRPVMIVKASAFNNLRALHGEDRVHPDKGEAIVVKHHQTNIMNEQSETSLLETPIELENGEDIEPDSLITSNVIPEMHAYYIVNDNDYDHLPAAVEGSSFIAWHAKKGDNDAIIKAGESLFDQFEPGTFNSTDFNIYQINKLYGPILFIGLFIGVVFFVSAGSFLYFRLYSDLDDDKEKFKAIAKMGLTEKELKKVINRQTAILFFAPIVVALIHGAVALTALSHMFDYILVKESTMVLGTFALIQIVYFIVVRYFYTKQIKRAIY